MKFSIALLTSLAVLSVAEAASVTIVVENERMILGRGIALEDAKKTIHLQTKKMRLCYEETMQAEVRAPSESMIGRIVIDFAIASDGEVIDSKVYGRISQTGRFETCIKRQVNDSFPPLKKMKRTRLKVPIRFDVGH